MAFAWKPMSEKQLDVIFGEWAQLNVLEGSVRSGKTVSSLVAWMRYCGEAPTGPLAMLGKTTRTLKRNILDPLQDMFGPELVQVNLGNGEATICGRLIYLFGGNDVRAEYNIRGGTWAGAYIDEATLLTEDFFFMLLSRVSVEGARIFCTTNPDSPYHWFHTKVLQREEAMNEGEELTMKRWRFRIDDNLSLDPAYVARLKRQYVGMWYKRFIDGEWTLAEGAIYGGLIDPDNEVAQSDIPLITQYFIGADYGISAYTAYVLLGLGIDNCLYALDEWGYSGDETQHPLTDMDLVHELYRFLGPKHIKRLYCDPSATSLITLLKRYGDIPIRKGYNRDVRYGIRCVAGLLGNNRLKFVQGTCPKLKAEAAAYVWDAKAALVGLDKPKKINDHFLDALRYAITGLRPVWRSWIIAPDLDKVPLAGYNTD